MQGALRALSAGGLGLATSFLVACGGGSSLLTGSDANKLNADLQQVSSALDSHQCAAASSAASAFTSDITNLPGDLNASLRKDLTDGASNLIDLIGKNCQVATTPTTTTATTPTTPSTHTTTSAPTTPTTHTTSPPKTTPTPATTPTNSGTTSTGSSGGVGIGGGPGAGGTGKGGVPPQ